MAAYASILKQPSSSRPTLTSQPQNSKPVLFGILSLVVIVVIGGFLIHAYLGREQARDLDDWEIRLALLADSRMEAIKRLFSKDLSGLNELASNVSLQLYLSQLESVEKEAGTEPAQLSYLRNLILAAAQREGLQDLNSSPQIRANVPQMAHSGLALVDLQGKIVTSTSAMPTQFREQRQALEQAISSGKSIVIDLHLDEGGEVLMGYVVPIHAIQSGRRQEIRGALIAIKSAAQHLYPLLASTGMHTDQDESLLLRRQEDQIQYISPLADGSGPLQRSLPLDKLNQAGATALLHTGQFSQARDYRGRDVLMISRAIPDTHWILMQLTGLDSALREARQHSRSLLTSFSLLLFFIAAALVAAWRHGSSVQAQRTAAALNTKTRELDAQSRLLHGITDHINAYTALLNSQHELVFANTPFARATGVTLHDLQGKSLASVLGPDTAKTLIEEITGNTTQGQTHSVTLPIHIGDQRGVYQCTFVPLLQEQQGHASLLMVLHDITELQDAQQRHAELMRKLVTALMHVVDLHDPHSGHHSARMAQVAAAISEAMNLDSETRQVIDLAASLANLGKIFVPREILTKTDALTPHEQELVRNHVQYSLDILKDLEFDGPVLDTISQKQELLDGSGYPKGLKGEEILLPARILAVANSFVALLSSRAYRGPASVQSALDALLQEAGKKYDRQVVAALFHVAENRMDWSEWEK